jgi:plasmid stabilization system protein ParE
VKLRITKRAQTDAARHDARWRDKKDKAPELFAKELRAALERVRTVAGAGTPFPTVKRPTLRRILMESTGYHVYFVLHENIQEIRIMVIWGARRRRPPKL